ncbi:TRADD-N-associated membrane domain-containing protein [Microbispora bryophytorum]|uniref:TRADD-N-associated membrane domain-containing protein n=1 Tax=Microbispora bryophytorum TaxID=1460882 RepID=UPI0033FC2A7C
MDEELGSAKRKRITVIAIYIVLIVLPIALLGATGVWVADLVSLGIADLEGLNAISGAILPIVVLVATAVLVGVYLLRQQHSNVGQAERALQDLQQAEMNLGDEDHLALPALWKVTHKRLDYYHQIATGQARQSFRNAQVAMAVGFGLLILFAVLAIKATTPTASVVAGALGAASAAFAAYIGRTFVRSQESAASHLRAYFEQPVEFSRYLAAERLLQAVDKLAPEQRAEIAGHLLRAIVASAPNGALAPNSAPAAPVAQAPPREGEPTGAGEDSV